MSRRVSHPSRSTGGSHPGFTLLEMILAMTVVSIALLVVVQAMARVQDTWKMTHSKVRQAQDARAGMETMSRTIARATLDGRWIPNNGDDPEFFLRDSDLHFVSGPVGTLLQGAGNKCGHAIFFQAPCGYAGPSDHDSSSSASGKVEYDTLPEVLNAWGYFVEFAADPIVVPGFLSGERRRTGLAPVRYRFRLMEYRQPAHELALFQMDASDPSRSKLSQSLSQSQLYEWFKQPISEASQAKRRCAVIAENVLGLIIQPLRDYEAVDSSSAGSTDIGANADPLLDFVHDSRRFQWDAGTLAATTRHRLPAMLKITLIVLDEKDWEKLSDEQALNTGNDLRILMAGRFSKPGAVNADIGSLTGELNRRRMRHREITTILRMPGSRWTTDREAN